MTFCVSRKVTTKYVFLLQYTVELLSTLEKKVGWVQCIVMSLRNVYLTNQSKKMQQKIIVFISVKPLEPE